MKIVNGVVTAVLDENVHDIVIPEGVTGIGYRAFSSCSKLQSVILPKSLKTIGEQAFYGCSSLHHITIPFGVSEIGELAFFKCINLSDLSLPNSILRIGDGAFCQCSSLETIVIPDSVEEIRCTIILNCNRLWRFCYRDVVIDLNPSYWIGKLDSDIRLTTEMIQTHQYEMELPDFIKFPTILAYRTKHPEKPLITYIRMNAEEILSYLMRRNDVDEICSLLQTDNLIEDATVMRHVLERAVQHTQHGGSAEIQMILMRYANACFPAETRRFVL